MRLARLLAFLMPLGLVAPVAGATAPSTLGTAAAAGVGPRVVAVRTMHRGGFDRVVFEFRGGLPRDRRVAYSRRLRHQGSGLPIDIPGQALLAVRFFPARHHHVGQGGGRAVRLPAVMTWLTEGDFEAVLVYGIGLAKRTPFHVTTRHHPDRVVIDIRASFPTERRKVFFFNKRRFTQNREPFFTRTWRPVRPQTPATGVMDRLFAGPVSRELGHGLRLVTSGATGYRDLTIRRGIARVRLTGGCNAHGSTVNVSGEIIPTLKQFASVRWVKIYGPRGHTADPTGPGDSIPGCLNP
jgi:hypothetical protein